MPPVDSLHDGNHYRVGPGFRRRPNKWNGKMDLVELWKIRNFSSSSKKMAKDTDGDIVMRGRSKSMPRTPAKTPVRLTRSLSRSSSKRKTAATRSRSRSRARSKNVTFAKTKTSSGGGAGVMSKTSATRKVSKKTHNARGISNVLEVSGRIQADDVVYLGHTTMPWQMTFRNMGQAMLKFLLNKWRFDVALTTQVLGVASTSLSTEGFLDGDFIRVRYKKSADPDTVGLSVSTVDFAFKLTSPIANAAQWNSLKTFGEAWESNFDRSALLGNSLEFLDMQFIPVPRSVPSVPATIIPSTFNYCRYYLGNATFEFSSVSNLKFQNRTYNTVGDNEADDIDNCPLFGLSYEGNGTGAVCKLPVTDLGMQQIPFRASYENGIIYSSDSDSNQLREPPEAGRFQGVTKSGKVSISPGEIRLSKLYYKKKHNISTLIRSMAQPNSSVDKPVFPTYKTGNFRFFAVEKVLNFADSAQPLRVAYEANLRQTVVFHPGYEKFGVATQHDIMVYTKP